MFLFKKNIWTTEVSALLKLALPVSLSQLSMIGMTATDTIVAGKTGGAELAGMSLGTNIWNIVLLFFMGIGMATQPIIAKKYGAGDLNGVRRQLIQSTWMCLLLGFFSILVTFVITLLFGLLDYEASLSRVASDYLFMSLLGTLPLTLIPAFRGTLEGIGHTRVILLISFAGFLINIPLDIALVSGFSWIPPLGGAGCALATAIVSWGMLLSYYFVLKCHPDLRKFSFLRSIELPDVLAIRDTFRFGLPIGLSICLELSMFSAMVVFVSYLGVVQASGHAIAMTVASMSFVLYLGLGQGITIRSSQLLGAKQPDYARRTVIAGLVTNLLISIIICLIFAFWGRYLVQAFTNDTAIVLIAVSLIYYAAMFQVVDCLQVSIISILRAYGNTTSALYAQCFAYLLFAIPAGGVIIYTDFFKNLKNSESLWTLIIASLFIVSIALAPKLLLVFNRKNTSSLTKV